MQSFFAGKMYGTNAETTFRLLAHLFALVLNDKKSVNLVPIIIMRFPHACFNKDKKRLGNIESILLNYFFAELDPNVRLVPLAEIGVKKPVYVVDFISAMKTALNKIDPSGLSKNKLSNMAKVNQWIEEYYQSTTKAEKPEAASSTEKVHADSVAKPVGDVTPIAPEATAPATDPHVVEVQPPVTAKKSAVPEESAGVIPTVAEERPFDIAYLIDLLSKAGKVATTVKTESAQQKIKIDALTQSLKDEQEKVHRANQRIANQQATIDELRKKLSDIEGDVFALRQDVVQRETVIAEKDVEIAERVKMAEVLSRDRSKQADESLQRLASKIRVEYRDFVDALDVPMSCDLGENLRLQLQSIFDILEKGGMKIK